MEVAYKEDFVMLLLRISHQFSNTGKRQPGWMSCRGRLRVKNLDLWQGKEVLLKEIYTDR